MYIFFSILYKETWLLRRYVSARFVKYLLIFSLFLTAFYLFLVTADYFFYKNLRSGCVY